MKKVRAKLLFTLMLFLLTACANSGATAQGSDTWEPLATPQTAISADETKIDTEGGTILVAYFSRAGENYNVGFIEKGNTEIVAEMIAEQTGGALFQIQTVNPYPESYDECKDIAQQERESDARPELAANMETISNYDVIFVGYPIWWGDMPMAVYTFLESHDLSGKTIISFCTHGGSSLANTVKSIANACPNAEVSDGLAVQGATAPESPKVVKEAVADWLANLGY